ncbi:hypothetical protein MSAN_01850100 [Mycena sanguinolenta]|uniref:Uncharacterized protein n=1 Tax=Mycena sanguinolenta TaxID=230812 RepID=A0A8H6XTC6_9AGAR|nr:hypothetical protein MSAN_01850100 [Mycena sanguinolenta]
MRRTARLSTASALIASHNARPPALPGITTVSLPLFRPLPASLRRNSVSSPPASAPCTAVVTPSNIASRDPRRSYPPQSADVWRARAPMQRAPSESERASVRGAILADVSEDDTASCVLLDCIPHERFSRRRALGPKTASEPRVSKQLLQSLEAMS